jgi:hypothetical protein
METYYEVRGLDIPGCSFMDYYFYFVAGMRKYIPQTGQSFIIPIKWLLFHLLILYGNLNYPDQDLSEPVGISIIMKSGSRAQWLISKYIWNLSVVLAMYMTALLAVLVFSEVTGADLSAAVTPELLLTVMNSGTRYTSFTGALGVTTVLLPFAVSVAVSTFQLTLTLYAKPVVAFLVTAILMISSAYCQTWWLIGNYAMMYRSSYIVYEGVKPLYGVICCVVLSVISVIAGCIRIKRYDIIRRSEM